MYQCQLFYFKLCANLLNSNEIKPEAYNEVIVLYCTIFVHSTDNNSQKWEKAAWLNCYVTWATYVNLQA